MSQSRGQILLQDPVEWSHPSNVGRTAWWLTLPESPRGLRFRDLLGKQHGILTSMDPATDWVGPRGRSGGWGALDLDGVDDWISPPGTIANYLTAATGSFACWYRPTGTAVERAAAYELSALFTDDQGYLGLHRGIIGGLDRIWAYNYVSAETRVGTPYTVGEWVHLVWVHGQGELRLFKNGQLAGSVASGNTGSLAGALRLGRGYSIAPYLAGLVDDLGFWSRALSAADVLELYGQSCQSYPDLLRRYRTRSYSVPEAAPGGEAFTRSLSESVSITDAVVRTSTASRSLQDSLTVQDQIIRLSTALRSLQDSVVTTDQFARQTVTLRQIADGLAIMEAISVILEEVVDIITTWRLSSSPAEGTVWELSN